MAYTPDDVEPSAQARWLIDTVARTLRTRIGRGCRSTRCSIAPTAATCSISVDAAMAWCRPWGRRHASARRGRECGGADPAVLPAGKRDVAGWLSDIEALRQERMRFVIAFRLRRPIPMLDGADPVEGTTAQERGGLPEQPEKRSTATLDCHWMEAKFEETNAMTTALEKRCRLPRVHGLFHIAVKTENLAATRNSLSTSIGMREFPPTRTSAYPGALARLYAARRACHPFTSTPAGRRWGRKARRRRAPRRSIRLRCRAPAIAPMCRASRRPDSTGANSVVPGTLALAVVRL